MSHQHSSGSERAAKDGLVSAVGAVVVAVIAIFIFFGLNTGHTNPDLAGSPAGSSSSTMAK